MRHAEKVEKLRGGIVVDVSSVEELRIAQDAGASAVRIPPAAVVPLTAPREEVAEYTRKVREMLQTAEIPVICRVPAGRYAEARLWVTLGAEMVHENAGEEAGEEGVSICGFPSEAPVFSCVRDWTTALRRLSQGAAGLCVEADTVRAGMQRLREIQTERLALAAFDREGIEREAERRGAPADLLVELRATDKLPALVLVDAGTSTPGAAALWRQLGADALYVSNAALRARDPVAQIRGIAEACAHPRDPEVLMRVCEDLGDPLTGMVASGLIRPERLWGAASEAGVQRRDEVPAGAVEA